MKSDFVKEAQGKHFLWFHNWEKWRDIDTGTYGAQSFLTGEWIENAGRFTLQERICQTCGKKQMRKVVTG